MLPRSVPSGQLSDLEGSDTELGGRRKTSERREYYADQQIQGVHLGSTAGSSSASVAKLQLRSELFERSGSTLSSAAMTTEAVSGSDRSRPSAIQPSSSSARLDGRSPSSNPSTTSSASSSNTISLPMSSSHARDSSSASSTAAWDPSKGHDTAHASSSSIATTSLLPSPRSHSETRHSSHPPLQSASSSSGPGNSSSLLHPLRVSTRPSTKRASSFTPGLVVSPQGYGAHHSTPSSPLHSPLYPPAARPDHRSGSIDLSPAIAQASSISLPIAREEELHHKLEELVRKTSNSKQKHQQYLSEVSSTNASSASASTSQLQQQSGHLHTSTHRDGYEAEREQDSEVTTDPSQPSSLSSQLASDVPTLSLRHHQAQQQQYQHNHASAGPSSRQYSTSTHPSASTSPHGAALRTSMSKARSREMSGSSNENPQVRDFATGDQTNTETDTGTDLASDAGNTTWDVRETDKLKSAKDAHGRRMINQYARVAELGKGVHGKVWLCENTETGEFFAIKSVNREDRRNKSLKRSQAEAQAKARVQELEDEAELEEQRRLERERNPNASFDEEMQLDDPIPQPTEKELARKKSVIIRKTMMDEKVKQEIAIMKRIHHPNVVQLREVIDDIRSKKIFMVLEYMPGGQVAWTMNDEPVMTVDETRRVFRDVVLGLEYLHFNGIIHRDIKPANLLWTQDRRTAKISDFGVSHVSEALARSSAANPAGGRVGLTDDRALRKTEGSPAFFAPELCSAFETTPVGTPINELGRTSSRPDYFRRYSSRGGERPGSSGSGGRLSPITRMTPGVSDRPTSKQRQSTASIMTISQPLTAQQQQTHKVRQNDRPMVGKGIDVWALGVTLYCLLFGYTPFHEARSEFELYNMIPKKEIVIPPTMGRDRLPTGSGVDRSELEHDPQYAEGREVVDLLSRLLEKDPTKRIELWQVKRHPWVLRNLENSQGWLQEHDLARRGLVEVTQEEVQQATAERTKPQVPQSGLKAAWKRFGETFGFGSHALRQSTATRRDRSKSFSSTSASMTTASGWDGRSDASRAASRQASIIKRKPSTISHAAASEEPPVVPEEQDLDRNLLSHAAALKRKLTNAKAALAAQDALSTSPPEDMPTKPYEHYRSTYLNQQQHALSRSLSGESSEPVDQQAKTEAKRRQSLGHLLQPPSALQRRVSSGASDASGPYNAPPNTGTRANISRPSLSSVSSRPSQSEVDGESQRSGGFRNFLNKLRSGSRTPAALPSPNKAPPTRHLTTSTVPSSDTSSEPAKPIGVNLQSPGSTRRASAEYIIFSPTTSNSRPSSQDTDADARPPFQIQATTTKDTVSTATVEGVSRGLHEEAVSDSSESLSDFDDDEEELPEAGSPAEYPNAGDLSQGDMSQPSSYGHPGGPVMWSNATEGWKFNPGMPTDPLGRYLRQQQHQSPEELTSQLSPVADLSASQVTEHTLRPDESDALAISARSSCADQSDQDDPGFRKPLFKTDYMPQSTPIEPRRMPSLFRDGSFNRSNVTKSSSPSPARLTRNIPALDDDDEEGEEVMIKLKSRMRRATNASSSASGSARPSMPASPRPSYYQASEAPS